MQGSSNALGSLAAHRNQVAPFVGLQSPHLMLNCSSCSTFAQSCPTATILLCTNRVDAMLDRAISSCLEQTVQCFELLIIVNGAQIAEMASELQTRYGHDHRVRVIWTDVRFLNFSLALGVHLARAPLIARMDSDDISAPDRLAVQTAFMLANPNVGVLATGFELIDSEGGVMSRVIPPTDARALRRDFYYRNPLCHPTVMLRAEAVRQVGGYLGGHHAEDYDLWCRLLVDGRWQIAAIPQLLLGYNSDSSGVARRSRSAYISMASTQLACLLASKDPRWLVGVLTSVCKLLFRARSS
jgi:glycosyltransferase involved in cell wall biosynthesis